jgi:hypothetical protein
MRFHFNNEQISSFSDIGAAILSEIRAAGSKIIESWHEERTDRRIDANASFKVFG